MSLIWSAGDLSRGMVALIAVLTLHGAPAYASFLDPFYTVGRLLVRAGNNEVERYETPEMRPYLEDSEQIMVLAPAPYAEADTYYWADIASGSVGAIAAAEDHGNGFSTAARVGTAFQDTIYFTVPQGVYTDGLTATLRGRFSGDIHAEGFITSTARATWAAELAALHGGVGGSAEVSGDTFFIRPPDNGSGYGVTGLTVDEPFELTITLVMPGLEVTSPFPTGIRFGLAVGGRDLALSGDQLRAEPTAASESNIGVVTSDFSTTGAIDALVLPAGLDWTSASGVFPDDLVVIPLPAGFWLLGSSMVLLGSAGLKNKKRKRGRSHFRSTTWIFTRKSKENDSDPFSH